MKKVAILLLAIIAFGCSEENGTEEEPWVEINIPNPNISRMLLTEVCESNESGVPDITREEEFLYSKGWMTKHATTQKYSIDTEFFTITRESSLDYNSNHTLATLTDQSDNKYVYTLNDQGYATQCTYTSAYQKRQYTFSYDNGYLVQLTEQVIPTDDITTEIISHTLTLNYQNGDLISVISPSLTNEAFTDYGENQIIYEAGKDINYYRLPCLQLLDTYPLSFHQTALFAGLLGKPTQHFTVYTYPKSTAEGYVENTTYTYKFDNDGKPTSLQSHTSYTGGAYSGSFPNKRNISIAIE